MIELTKEQRRQLRETVPEILDPATKEIYVLVRKEAYERMKALLADDTVYTTAEMLDRVRAEDDANDPYLAELQNKERP
jgi:hypothetical protein